MASEIRPDGPEGWKRVACVDEAWTTEGWSCHVTELRAIRVTWGNSYPNNPVTLPMDMTLGQAMGLTVEGIAAFQRLGRDDGCQFNIHASAEFRNFGEQARQAGEWRLEAADKPGEFRLVNEPYYVQFDEPSEDKTKKPRACWDMRGFHADSYPGVPGVWVEFFMGDQTPLADARRMVAQAFALVGEGEAPACTEGMKPKSYPALRDSLIKGDGLLSFESNVQNFWLTGDLTITFERPAENAAAHVKCWEEPTVLVTS